MARRRSSDSADNGDDHPRYFTTHQAAQLMGVSIPTVVNWCDSGRLHAHRTGGGHRRIPREDLVRFARERGVRLQDENGGGKRRVLIVDDERDFSEMLRDYLKIKGFEVEIAESGFMAGLTVARFQPDIILMDIMMPDMDGFQVQRRLRADPTTADVPIIACTAYRDPALDARVEGESFDGFVEKPLKMSSLLEMLESTLDARG